MKEKTRMDMRKKLEDKIFEISDIVEPSVSLVVSIAVAFLAVRIVDVAGRSVWSVPHWRK